MTIGAVCMTPLTRTGFQPGAIESLCAVSRGWRRTSYRTYSRTTKWLDCRIIIIGAKTCSRTTGPCSPSTMCKRSRSIRPQKKRCGCRFLKTWWERKKLSPIWSRSNPKTSSKSRRRSRIWKSIKWTHSLHCGQSSQMSKLLICWILSGKNRLWATNRRKVTGQGARIDYLSPGSILWMSQIRSKRNKNYLTRRKRTRLLIIKTKKRLIIRLCSWTNHQSFRRITSPSRRRRN